MSSTMTAGPAAEPTAGSMSHRQVLEALSGLLLGLFVTILSSTVVSTSLPRIIADLGGGQSAFTWVVTSTLLALTASTPIWGKLADLVDRKLLVQVALVIFVIGSAQHRGRDQQRGPAGQPGELVPGQRHPRQESAAAGSPVGDAGVTAADAAGLEWEAGEPARPAPPAGRPAERR
jgi:hypothetical protein